MTLVAGIVAVTISNSSRSPDQESVKVMTTISVLSIVREGVSEMACDELLALV